MVQVKKLKIAIVGDGTMGTALAHVAANAGHQCILLTDDRQVVENINHAHSHPVFFNGLKLHSTLTADYDWEKWITTADLIIMAVPSFAMRETARRIASWINEKQAVLSVTKGFEPTSHCLMSEVLSDSLPTVHLGILSGPNITLDLVKNLPTKLMLASPYITVYELGQQALSTPWITIDVTKDMRTYEYVSALKNVIALEVGLVTGLGLGDNFRALVLAEGLAEISGLLEIMELQANAMYGLAGLADIFLTCSSTFAHNYAIGVQLGEGAILSERLAILHARGEIAEGIESLKAASILTQRHNYIAPLLMAAHSFVFEHADRQRGITDFQTAGLAQK